jgi:RNA polymerase sigma-54 factor
MAITTRLELRQGQQLVMTPQLQQAIRLLQLSNLELNAFVETELERNPLLERDGEPLVAAQSAGEAQSTPETAETLVEPEPAGLDLLRQPAAAASELDADADSVDPDAGPGDFFPDAATGGWSSLRQSGRMADDEPDLEAYLSEGLSLRDHLARQMNLAIADPVDRMIGAHLIDMVDDAGYLRADLGELAGKLGATGERVERVLAKLQTLEPTGVFARDLKECLALQLKERGRYDPLIARFLEALPLLAAHDLAGLRKAVGVDAEDLSDMIAEIRTLNPKPGLAYGTTQVQTVVPDIFVRASVDGSWVVELNSETLPRVLINRHYYTRVSKAARTGKDKDFLMECLQSASWLVKSLDQRARTILRVAEEIVRQQDRFLAHGVQHLRPLNLKTVAEAIRMHESTVSRVTSNKYIATPRGIFELKYFFTSAIASAGDGEAHSSEAVRFRIKALIDAETPTTVLSDDKLVELLGNEGIEIARRTVAKYREAMQIPSSVQRRRAKRLRMEQTALAS